MTFSNEVEELRIQIERQKKKKGVKYRDQKNRKRQNEKEREWQTEKVCGEGKSEEKKETGRDIEKKGQ